MNKAVIFDLDGTLLDTLPDIVDSVNIALKKFGFPARDSSEVRLFIGNGARNLITKSLGDGVNQKTIDECLDYYNEIYTNSGSPKTHVFEGIEQLVNELKKRGFITAILTNKPQMTTDDVYATYLSSLGFDMVVGQSEKVKCKPDKEAALNILNKFNVPLDRAFLVGDGDADVLTALNANITGISALWGYRTKQELERVGAVRFANKPQDVFQFISI